VLSGPETTLHEPYCYLVSSDVVARKGTSYARCGYAGSAASTMAVEQIVRSRPRYVVSLTSACSTSVTKTAPQVGARHEPAGASRSRQDRDEATRRLDRRGGIPMSESLIPGPNQYNQDGLTTIHNHDFMDSPAFQAAYQRGVTATGTDYNRHWRVHTGLWGRRDGLEATRRLRRMWRQPGFPELRDHASFSTGIASGSSSTSSIRSGASTSDMYRARSLRAACWRSARRP
jgi:hypothetical protein